MNSDENNIPIPAVLREARGWPELTADERAELRPAALAVLAASKTAAGLVQRLAANGGAHDFWRGVAITAASSLSAMSAGLCLLGSAVALVAAADPQREPSTPHAPEAGAEPEETTR